MTARRTFADDAFAARASASISTPLECPLPELAHQQPDEKVLFVSGCSSQEIAKQTSAIARRSATAGGRNPLEYVVHVDQ
jgi:hypothetical protein